MTMGRVLSALAASVAVGGCAVVVVGMSQQPTGADAGSRHPSSSAAPSSRPAFPADGDGLNGPAAVDAEPGPLGATPTRTSAPTSTLPSTSLPSTSASHAGPRPPAPPTSTTGAPAVAAPPRASTLPARARAVPNAVVRRTAAPAAKPTIRPTVKPAARPAAPKPSAARKPAATPKGQRLPLRYGTGSATRVITVVARSHSRTTATLQAWTKVSGGWRKYGSAVTAHVGADGVGTASETRSATPAGGFTLTRAFGHDRDPGTALPYVHTNSSYWWISQRGKLYNTMQSCSAHCAFTRGNPNEHLYYETPYYNYAVVIDYNTRNAPGGVKAGKGSAFFLHVTDGHPTAGCVAIPQSRLVTLMRWLTPAAHPRILIGVA